MNAPELKERAFRRLIRIEIGERRIRGALEDDFHRFNAEVEHDGERVTAVRSESPRAPRSICPEAVRPLQDFVGLPLDRTKFEGDPRLQCTHLFDLVKTMLVQAARARGLKLPLLREFEMEVPYPKDGRMRAELRIDGTPTLSWELVDRRIVAPAPFEGVDCKGKAEWPAGLDNETLDAAKMLRRSVWLGSDRSQAAVVLARGPLDAKFDTYNLKRMRGNCFAHQPENQERSTGTRGENILDFTDSPERMLADW